MGLTPARRKRSNHTGSRFSTSSLSSLPSVRNLTLFLATLLLSASALTFADARSADERETKLEHEPHPREEHVAGDGGATAAAQDGVSVSAACADCNSAGRSPRITRINAKGFKQKPTKGTKDKKGGARESREKFTWARRAQKGFEQEATEKTEIRREFFPAFAPFAIFC